MCVKHGQKKTKKKNNMTDDFVSYEIEDYKQFENFEDIFKELSYKEADNEKNS